jgi:hypothetical protein
MYVHAPLLSPIPTSMATLATCAMLTQATAIHSLTDTCFRKCIPAGNVKNGKLDKYEEPCMRQCVDRFLDANMVVLRELERLRG